MSNVLVTGGLGFIGSHTVDELIQAGHSVVVVDNLESQVHHGKMPSYKNRQSKYIISDIRNRKTWLNALKNVDAIIHLAGTVGIGQSFWQARKYIDANVRGTATLFEILLSNKSLSRNIQSITVASSKSLYGEGSYYCKDHGSFHPQPRNAKQLKDSIWELKCPVCGVPSAPIPIQEEETPQNLNPYSLSKYATERLALDYADVLGIRTVALRYFNVYGPRQSLSNPYTGVVAIFLSRLKNNNSPYIFEDGLQVRDYIYVKDVARVNYLSLEHGSGVYNVGTGTPTSLRQVVGALNEGLSKNIEPTISGEFRPGDNRHDYADNKRLSSDYGITEFVPFRKGIAELISDSEKIEARDYFEREERERQKYLTGRN